MNNYIYEYYQKITDGTIIVGRWIKVWYKYVVDGLEKGLFHFDPKKAQKAIRFVENFCRHHEGALAPQLIVLELWQKALLSVLFGVMDDTDHRQFREVVVIIGPSGCGKSTVVNLLFGAFRPNTGVITVGGKKLESLSRASYYSHLAVVSYNTYIFNETVRANFRLAKPQVTDEEICAALEKVNLLTFLQENGGLDKIITEDAANISGGQKQRLALAVSLVADKDIYIFDEATSNIDIESEAVIMENIRELSKTKSVIVISHRLANVVPADLIYYMEAGRLIESGTHTALMARNGGYARLYATQKNLEEGYAEVLK